MVPINITHHHWVVAFVNMKNKFIWYFDSLGRRDTKNRCRDILRFLQDDYRSKKKSELPGGWRVGYNKRCFQRTGHQCGPFICVATFCLLRKLPLTFVEDQMNFWRMRVALWMVNGQTRATGSEAATAIDVDDTGEGSRIIDSNNGAHESVRKSDDKLMSKSGRDAQTDDGHSKGGENKKGSRDVTPSQVGLENDVMRIGGGEIVTHHTHGGQRLNATASLAAGGAVRGMSCWYYPRCQMMVSQCGGSRRWKCRYIDEKQLFEGDFTLDKLMAEKKAASNKRRAAKQRQEYRDTKRSKSSKEN